MQIVKWFLRLQVKDTTIYNYNSIVETLTKNKFLYSQTFITMKDLECGCSQPRK